MAPADSCTHLVIIITTILTFLVTVALSIVSGVGDGLMYPASTVAAYYMFVVSFDVAPWVHFIWIPIGLWQALWIVYVLATLCRRDPVTGYALYCAPGSIPLSTYGTFSCALVSVVCSQVALSNGYLEMSFTFDLLCSFTLFLAIYFSSRTLGRHAALLIRTGRPGHVTLVRGLVHNGIGLFEGWIDFVAFLKLGKVIVFYGRVDGETAGGICLTLYVLYLAVRLVLDATLWDVMLRHLMTPYLASVVAMVGVMTQNFDIEQPTTLHYVIASVLGAVVLLAVIRIVEMCLRNRSDRKRTRADDTDRSGTQISTLYR